MSEHVAHWTGLAESGEAVALGPLLDPSGVRSLGLLDLANAERVGHLTAEDPVTKAGLGSASEIHPTLHLTLRRAPASNS